MEHHDRKFLLICTGEDEPAQLLYHHTDLSVYTKCTVQMTNCVQPLQFSQTLCTSLILFKFIVCLSRTALVPWFQFNRIKKYDILRLSKFGSSLLSKKSLVQIQFKLSHFYLDLSRVYPASRPMTAGIGLNWIKRVSEMDGWTFLNGTLLLLLILPPECLYPKKAPHL